MEKKLLKEKITSSILDMYNYLKKQDYYEDINSYALYSDDSYMSLTLVFNTNFYLNRRKSEKYYLTYKYNPAEWFSETLKNDPVVYKNIYFDEITHILKEWALLGLTNEKILIDCCIGALKDFKKHADLEKDTLLLFMISDCFDEDEIVKWNNQLNTNDITEEIKIWIENG